MKLKQILLEVTKEAIVISMPEEGILKIRKVGSSKWVEVRGEYNVPNNEFQNLIDFLPGPSVSSLFADGEIGLTAQRNPKEYKVFSDILNTNFVPDNLPKGQL